MTPESSNQPLPEDESFQPASESPRSSGAESSFEELNGSPSAISIELLEASDETRLSQILSQALENDALLNQFAGCLIPLCEDPSQEALVTQDRLCRVVGSQVRGLGGDDFFENTEKLRKLSNVTDAILLSCQVNPRARQCEGLQELLRAEVDLLSQMDMDRGVILDAENRAALGKELSPTVLNDWTGLYLDSLEQVLIGLKIPGFEPSAALLEECRELVAAQLSWTQVGMGPTESRTSGEGQLWSETLGFARAVADCSVETPLMEIALSLVRWFNEGAWNTATAPIREEGTDGVELYNMLGWLELAEHRAMAALLRAQTGCEVETLWKEVLETRPLGSRAARVALHGLARSDATETAEYISKLLNRIGSDKCSPALAERYLDTLILVASEPGMPEVIMSAWNPDVEYPIDPLHKELLLARVDERLELHNRYVEPARARVQQCGDDLISRQRIENRASKKGVIWSKRALLALQALGLA
jgi:hypothetical protein